MSGFFKGRPNLATDIISDYMEKHPYAELTEEAEASQLLVSMELQQRYEEAVDAVVSVLPETVGGPRPVIDISSLEIVALRAMTLTDGDFTKAVALQAIEQNGLGKTRTEEAVPRYVQHERRNENAF